MPLFVPTIPDGVDPALIEFHLEENQVKVALPLYPLSVLLLLPALGLAQSTKTYKHPLSTKWRSWIRISGSPPDLI